MASPGFEDVLKPFLINLAQEGYPDPEQVKDDQELMRKYIKKTGETSAVKKIFDLLNSSKGQMDAIKKKYTEVKDYAI